MTKLNRGLANKIDIGAMRNDAPIVAHVEQLSDGHFAVFAIVQSALIHIHTNEAVGESWMKVASKLHRVGQGLFAVVERMLNAVTQGIGGRQQSLGAERAANS